MSVTETGRGADVLADKYEVLFSEKNIDAIFKDVDQSLKPGAAVGISIRGIPVYRKGFGLASIDLPVVLTPSIRMRIGSVSKHFTAFAFMRLCDDGLASIDDTVGMYLAELSPVTHNVTMRQLMGNTSGLWEANDIACQFSGPITGRVTAEELLSFYRDESGVNAQPGTTYIYNNGGWLILGAVIEKITGETLAKVLRERVFEPTGMNDTWLHPWDDVFAPNRASAHLVSEAGGYERGEICGGKDYAGAGGIDSTADDMLRWMAHMSHPHVGSAETWRLMKSPQTLPNGTSTDYGLGLEQKVYRGVVTLGHGGGGNGSNALMLKVPGAELDVIVMVNAGDLNAGAYARQILDGCLPNLEPVRTQPEKTPLKGLFRSSRTGRVAYLFTYEREPSDSPLHPEPGAWICALDGHYVPVEWDRAGAIQSLPGIGIVKLKLSLVGDPAKPSSIQLSDFGNLDELTALELKSEASAAALVGRYRSGATQTDAVIAKTEDGLTLTTLGRFGCSKHRLDALADGIWRTTGLMHLTRPPRALLTTDDSGDFYFSTTLTRNVRFQKVE